MAKILVVYHTLGGNTKAAAEIVARGGGSAVDSVQRVVSSFKFREVIEPVLVRGRPDSSAEEELLAAGSTLAQACR